MPQTSARPPCSATPQRYQFVSGFDKSYPAHIRAHVLLRHMRERRNNPARLNRLSTRDSVIPCQNVPRSTISKRKQQNTSTPSVDTTYSRSVTTVGLSDEQSSSLVKSSAAAPIAGMAQGRINLKQSHQRAATAESCSTLSSSTFSSSFSFLPIRLSHRDKFLVHHCRLRLLFMMYCALLDVLN